MTRSLFQDWGIVHSEATAGMDSAGFLNQGVGEVQVKLCNAKTPLLLADCLLYIGDQQLPLEHDERKSASNVLCTIGLAKLLEEQRMHAMYSPPVLRVVHAYTPANAQLAQHGYITVFLAARLRKEDKQLAELARAYLDQQDQVVWKCPVFNRGRPTMDKMTLHNAKRGLDFTFAEIGV